MWQTFDQGCELNNREDVLLVLRRYGPRQIIGWVGARRAWPNTTMSSTCWFLYALRCADDTVYTGVTTDLARRVREHNSGQGARYTASRSPVTLIGAWRFTNRGAAQRAEARFRRLPRREKLRHIAQRLSFSGSAFRSDEVGTA